MGRFTYSRNRHRPALEVNSNRGEPCRSPGLRFIGAKLPSQRLKRQWLACFTPRRLQWPGRAGFAPASLAIQSLKFYTVVRRSSSRDIDREQCSNFGAKAFDREGRKEKHNRKLERYRTRSAMRNTESPAESIRS
jgi:hypothetical protein